MEKSGKNGKNPAQVRGKVREIHFSANLRCLNFEISWSNMPPAHPKSFWTCGKNLSWVMEKRQKFKLGQGKVSEKSVTSLEFFFVCLLTIDLT